MLTQCRSRLDRLVQFFHIIIAWLCTTGKTLGLVVLHSVKVSTFHFPFHCICLHIYAKMWSLLFPISLNCSDHHTHRSAMYRNINTTVSEHKFVQTAERPNKKIVLSWTESWNTSLLASHSFELLTFKIRTYFLKPRRLCNYKILCCHLWFMRCTDCLAHQHTCIPWHIPHQLEPDGHTTPP